MKLIDTILLNLVITMAVMLVIQKYGGGSPKVVRRPLYDDPGTFENVVPLDEDGRVTRELEIYWIESSDMLGASPDGESAELAPVWRMTGLWLPENSPIAKSLWVPVEVSDLAEGEMILVHLHNYHAIGAKVEREGSQWLLGLNGLKLTSREWIWESLLFAEWYETVVSEENIRFIVVRKSSSTTVGVDGIDLLRRGSFSLADGSRFNSVRIMHSSEDDSCFLAGFLTCADAPGEIEPEYVDLPTCDYTQVDTAAVATEFLQMKCPQKN